jgi:tRNA threonylcarbamoyladenosine biosynthesis protein TsaE
VRRRATARGGGVVLSRSAAETESIGERLARDLPAGSVVLLRGRLGTGKTTLARGLARGFGLQDPDAVSSPSFTLVNVYAGRWPIHHVDLYRLDRRGVESLGLDEILGGGGVAIVEWSERLPFRVPDAVDIELEDAGGDDRVLRIRSIDFEKEKPRRRTSKRRAHR